MEAGGEPPVASPCDAGVVWLDVGAGGGGGGGAGGGLEGDAVTGGSGPGDPVDVAGGVGGGSAYGSDVDVPLGEAAALPAPAAAPATH